MQNPKPLQKTAAAILTLAKRHGVAYTRTANDAWAKDVTRLADDDVTLDEIELLLIELQRTGHLSCPEALKLQVNYLREAIGAVHLVGHVVNTRGLTGQPAEDNKILGNVSDLELQARYEKQEQQRQRQRRIISS